MKRILAIILAALMLTGLTSCGSGNDNSEQTTTNGTDSTDTSAESTEPSRETTPDSLPADLDFNAQTINIYYFGMEDAEKYDAIGESSGDIVYDAVYNRNVSVEERLNVKLNWIKGSDDWNNHPNNVQKALLAGVSDYDIIFEENSRAFQHSLQGFFYDLIDAPYIDYTKPWWYTNLMNEGSIDSSKRFFVTGDFSLTTLFGASTVYYNKEIFQNNFGDYTSLYNTVLDGKWTHELFMNYCRDVYNDLNGDGTADENDLFGFRFKQWGVPNHLSMSTGLSYSTRDANGYPVINLNSEEAVKWAETLYTLLYRDNISMEDKSTDELSLVNSFSQQRSLFFVGSLGNAGKLRDVIFDYGVLPHPKLSEELDYSSGAATANGEGAVIPLSAPIEKFDADCAVLEALSSQSYRTVVPTWYDTALKIKYVATDSDAQMIDLIYSKINSPFIMIADKTIGIGSIFTSAVYGSKSEGSYASFIAKNEKSYQTKLDKMINQYKDLET